MSRSLTMRIWLATSFHVAGSLLRLVLWYLPVSLSLAQAPALATVLLSLVTVVSMVLWYTRRAESMQSRRRFATLGLRRIGPATRWIAGIAIMMPLSTIFISALLMQCGYPLDQAPNPLDPFLRRSYGWLSVGAVIVLVAPVLEEFTFRGWIQHRLERQLGAQWGIGIAAMLFALAHGSVLRLPLFFLDGVILGAVVYLTRSIWAGVVVHAGNNALAALFLVPPVAHALTLLRTPSGGAALAGLGVSSLLFALLARGLWRATRRPGAPHAYSTPAACLAPGNLSQ